MEDHKIENINRKDKTYEYNFEFQTLQQYDSCGKLISSMQMPVEDLEKINFLAWCLQMDKTVV